MTSLPPWMMRETGVLVFLPGWTAFRFSDCQVEGKAVAPSVNGLRWLGLDWLGYFVNDCTDVKTCTNECIAEGFVGIVQTES